MSCLTAFCVLQDGEPVSKNAENMLQEGQKALDLKTGAVEQKKVRVSQSRVNDGK